LAEGDLNPVKKGRGISTDERKGKSCMPGAPAPIQRIALARLRASGQMDARDDQIDALRAEPLESRLRFLHRGRGEDPLLLWRRCVSFSSADLPASSSTISKVG
jgi:hypothetical protein